METILNIHKALADPNRLRIFHALECHGELCACQITELLEITGATISRHLGIMVNAGILKKRKQGRFIYFRLNRENPLLPGLVAWGKGPLEESSQIQRDRAALEGILAIPCEELFKSQQSQ
ncbi:MAG: metalloregulator ArsR/SmtB family transcription factor [Desulfobacterales bacterium]|nr:metalloregulator ArsR/SmtB family transcription factor [Desulfobacterales bacterium]